MKADNIIRLHIRWDTGHKRIPPDVGGYISGHHTLSECWRKVDACLKIIGKTSSNEIRAWRVRHGTRQARLFEFDTHDRTWTVHIYRDQAGARKLQPFKEKQ